MEPLSISSGAAGLISLGITVCHGLLDYYRSWRDAEDRVTHMYASIEALTETFRLLESAISSQLSRHNGMQRVEQSISSAERGVQSLQKKLDRVRLVALQSGWKAKSMAQFRRTLFPFKESTLAKLKELGIELRQDLMLALEVMHIESSTAAEKKSDLIHHGLNRISVNVDMVQEKSTLISKNVQNIEASSRDTSKSVDGLVTTQITEHRRNVQNWLSPLTVKFQKTQLDTFNTQGRQDSAAKFLLETTEFRQWLNTPGETLWCPGIPGTGKTIFASYVINHLQGIVDQKSTCLTYMYLSYKDAEKQSLSNLVASLVCQLAFVEPVLPAELAASYTAHAFGATRPSPAECTQFLRTAVNRCTTVFLVIDAFDEYPEEWRGQLLQELQTLQPRINLLVTSRDLPTIARQFLKATRLDVEARREDISQYLQERIATSEGLKAYTQKDPTLSDLISSTIAARAKNMFLQARLHLDFLTTKTTLRKLKTALTALPEGLTNTYDESMDRINTQHPDQATLAQKVLYWVFHAYRPLTMLELQHALAVETGDSSLDEDNITDEVLLLSVCNGLITYGKEGGSLALVHYTFQQYLEQKAEKIFPQAQIEIFRTCLTYISFNEFGQGPCHDWTDLSLRLEQWPLLSYAVENLGHHAHEEAEEVCKELILSFLSQGIKLSASIQALCVTDPVWFDDALIFSHFPSEIPALWFASFYGLEYTVSCLLAVQRYSIECKTMFGDTALHAAASCANVQMFELLLSNGADIHAKTRAGNTPLHLVSVLPSRIPIYNEVSSGLGWNRMQYNARTQANSLHIARLLLDHGADVNAVNLQGETVLHFAIATGLDSLTQVLVARGANITLRDVNLRSPLTLAFNTCNEELLQTLLKHDLPRQIQCGTHDHAMWIAALEGEPSLLQKFLAKLSEVIRPDAQGRNLLQASAFRGNLECFEFLKDSDLNIEWVDLQRRTCLHFAAASRHTESIKILEYLLNQGLNPRQRDIDGWTPLFWAAKAGNTTNIQALLGVNTDGPYHDDRDWIPFAIAEYHGNSHASAMLRPPNRSLPQFLQPHQFGLSLLHSRYICDGCDLYIVGSRHQCAVCQDFDFCFKCILSAEVTHPSHRFDFIYWDDWSEDVQKMEGQEVMEWLTARENFMKSWRA